MKTLIIYCIPFAFFWVFLFSSSRASQFPSYSSFIHTYLLSCFSFPVLFLLHFLFYISFLSSNFSFHFGLHKAYHHFIITICPPSSSFLFFSALFLRLFQPLPSLLILPLSTYHLQRYVSAPLSPFPQYPIICFFIVSSLFSKHRIQRHFNSWILLANCNFIYYRQITERLFPAQTKFWQTKA